MDGDPDALWKTAMTVRDGRIVAMNADNPQIPLIFRRDTSKSVSSVSNRKSVL